MQFFAATALLLASLAERAAAQSLDLVWGWDLIRSDTGKKLEKYRVSNVDDPYNMEFTVDAAALGVDTSLLDLDCRAFTKGNRMADKADISAGSLSDVVVTHTELPYTLFGTTGDWEAGKTYSVWCVPYRASDGAASVPYKITITIAPEPSTPTAMPVAEPVIPVSETIVGADGREYNTNATCESVPLNTSGPFCGVPDVIVLEAEDFPLADADDGVNWELTNHWTGSLNGCYRDYVGENDFGRGGRRGMTSVTIVPATTGEYIVQMKSYIGIGTQTSEHNDVWVRLKDPDGEPILYGWVKERKVERNKNIDFQINFPKGDFTRAAYLNPDWPVDFPPANVTATGSQLRRFHGSPKWEHAAVDPGWVKVYRHDPLELWDYKSRTGDNQGYEVMAYMLAGQNYTFEISGRSTGHAVDRFIIHTADISYEDAESDTDPIPRSPLCA